MRIVWQDSESIRGNFKPIKYRKHTISGYDGGWVVDIPGDNNIYKNNYCAMNAIDKHYGDGERGTEKRRNFGIQIIGQISDTICL